jgi:predicted aldo/keto reductase-like oxidoreductase
MVRVTGPFLSLDARGTLADTLTASFWRGINYIRTRVVPHNPKSAEQTAVRSTLTDGVSKWRFNVVTQLQKNFWNTYAKGLGESGFNRYMRRYIQENFDGTQKVTPEVMPSPV